MQSQRSKIFSKQTLQWALCTFAIWTGMAHAQTPPQIPTISCTTDPAIFNTGIKNTAADGSNAGYSSASGKKTHSTTTLDDHWYQMRTTTDLTTAALAANPVPDAQTGLTWARSIVYRTPIGNSAWVNSPYNNAEWLGVQSSQYIDSSNQTYTYMVYRYQFNIDSQEVADSLTLTFNGYTDDYLRRIWVNDTLVKDYSNSSISGIPSGAWGIGGYGPPSSGFVENVVVGSGWKVGLNSMYIQVVVLDDPTGLLFQTTGKAVCQPNLYVTKSAVNLNGTPFTGQVTAGQTVYYDVTVTNAGSVDASGTVLRDPLPSNFTSGTVTACTAPNAGGATCPSLAGASDATNIIKGLTLSTLQGGSSLKFRVQALLNNPLNTAVVTNTATIEPPAGFSCGPSADYATPCSASAPLGTKPVLSVSKSVISTGPLYPGSTASYKVQVMNKGGSLSGVTLSDPLPSGFASATWRCQPSAGSTAACPTPSSGNLAEGGTLSSTIGSLAANQSLDYIIDAKVWDATRLTSVMKDVTNTATVAATGVIGTDWLCADAVTGVTKTPCTAEAKVDLLPLMAITLTKTATVDTGVVYPGSTITYTVKANNATGKPVTSGTLADTWPTTGLSGPTVLSCVLTDASNNPVASQPASCLAAQTLQPGQTLTYTASGTVTAAAGTTITNTATWTPDDVAHTTCNSALGACSVPVNHTVSAKPIIAVAANVAPSTNVLPGSTVNYTLIFSNTGTVNAPNVEVHAPVNTLSGVTINSAWTCDAAASLPSTPASICDDFVATTLPAPPPAGTLSGSFGSLPVGAKVVFKATGLVDAMLAQGASVTLTASDTTTAKVHTCDPASRTNTTTSACEADATFTVSTPMLGITHTASPNTNLPPGASTVYTITVTNPGVFIVADAQVLAGPALAPNAANVTPTSVTCAVTDPTPAPGVASTCPTGLAVSGQTITSNADGLFNPGAQYLITVNANVSATAPFSSSIDLPATIGSGSLGPLMTCNPGTKSGSTCEAVANIALSGPPVLSVSNSVNSAVAAPNSEVLYTIIAKNESGSPIADGVLITDPASIPNITLGDWVCVHSNTTLACPVPNGSGPLNQGAIALAVGESLTYTVKGKIAAAAPDGAVIDVDAKFTSAATGTTCLNSLDGTPVPCRQRATVTVNYAPPVLSITNVVAPTTAAPDDEVTFTIVAKNTLGKPLTDGVITTDTPANITLGAWTCVAAGGAACPAASGTGAINAAAANIPMNGTLTYAIKGKIATGTADNTAITLNASITSATAGVTCAGTPTSLPCKAPATVTVKLKPSVLSLTHTAIPDTVAPGGKSTFTIVATNNSGQAITDGVLTTDSPANLSLGTWTCTASGGAMCPKAGAVTKASGPLNLTALSLPVGGSLTFTAEGTLGTTLKDGDSVTLMANLNSATAGTTCLGGTALPCVAPATVNIKVAAVVSPAPIPVDARWMLIALSVLLALAAAAHQQRARKGMRQ